MRLMAAGRCCNMFRVSYSESIDGQRWTISGRLAGPWVDELRSYWKDARERAPLAHATVDLKEIIYIDPGGEALLAEMQKAGTELIATGVANKHLIASLDHDAKSQGESK
jgi:hypothetical protein